VHKLAEERPSRGQPRLQHPEDRGTIAALLKHTDPWMTAENREDDHASADTLNRWESINVNVSKLIHMDESALAMTVRECVPIIGN
jgi:hypothetical protein